MVAAKNLLFFLVFSVLVACAPSKQIDTLTELENTNWILVEYDGKEYQPVEGGEPVTFVLQSERHSVKGFGGCNAFSGSYTHSKNILQCTLLSTKKFCRDTMEVEDYLFKALMQVEYNIEGDLLMLKNDEGRSLTFKKG